jgi:hypothetical protein
MIKKMIVAAAGMVLLLSACAAAPATPEGTPPPFDELEPKASALVDALIAGDYEAATADFDATMQTALPADKLQESWESLPKQIGAYQDKAGSRTDTQDGYAIVFETLQFEKARLDVRVVFNPDQSIAGLFFSAAR